jgi:hypothetical protein
LVFFTPAIWLAAEKFAAIPPPFGFCISTANINSTEAIIANMISKVNIAIIIRFVFV